MANRIITIARGFGSGGRTIGMRLAQEMGVAYYDRDLIRLASEKSGIHERLFGQVDEKKTKSPFKKAEKVYKGQPVSPGDPAFVSDDNLFSLQAQTIRELAARESCVIVGRCADYVLHGVDGVTRVFVYAPLDQCVQTVSALYGISPQEAEKQIRTIDKQRADYYRYHTGRNWNDADNYDLSLNSGPLGFDGCVALIRDYQRLLER